MTWISYTGTFGKLRKDLNGNVIGLLVEIQPVLGNSYQLLIGHVNGRGHDGDKPIDGFSMYRLDPTHKVIRYKRVI